MIDPAPSQRATLGSHQPRRPPTPDQRVHRTPTRTEPGQSRSATRTNAPARQRRAQRQLHAKEAKYAIEYLAAEMYGSATRCVISDRPANLTARTSRPSPRRTAGRAEPHGRLALRSGQAVGNAVRWVTRAADRWPPTESAPATHATCAAHRAAVRPSDHPDHRHRKPVAQQKLDGPTLLFGSTNNPNRSVNPHTSRCNPLHLNTLLAADTAPTARSMYERGERPHRTEQTSRPHAVRAAARLHTATSCLVLASSV